ncbi:transposase [Castellaniella caeni]
MEQGKTQRGVPPRSYNRAFKTRILRECAQPGATVAQVARAHGMNTNNIYRWRRQLAVGELKLVGGAEFVALEIASAPKVMARDAIAAQPPAACAMAIEVQVQRAALHVKLSWPVQAAGECAAWLRELLR